MKHLVPIIFFFSFISVVYADEIIQVKWNDPITMDQSSAILNSDLKEDILNEFNLYLSESHFVFGGNIDFETNFKAATLDFSNFGYTEEFILVNYQSSLSCGSAGCHTYVLKKNSHLDEWDIVGDWFSKDLKEVKLDNKKVNFYLRSELDYASSSEILKIELR